MMHLGRIFRGITLAVGCAVFMTEQTQALTFSVTSDSRTSSGFADVLEEIKLRAGGPGDFMISTGDIDPVYATRNKLEAAFGAGFLWYPVVGNHETPGGGTELNHGQNMDYLRSYDYGAVNPGPAGCVETTYSFDAGPVHISVINQYFDGTSDTGADGDVVPELLAWLANDLAATDRTWKLVFGHEPAYPLSDQYWSTQRHIGNSLDGYPANRDAFWALLEAEHVVAYVTAHTHRFNHYRPAGSDVWQIDTGQAQEIGQYDTFMMVNAEDNTMRFDIYRSLGRTQFGLVCSWTVTSTPQSDAPTDLSARAASWDRIDLHWSDNSTGESGFRIERKTAGRGYTQLGTVGADSQGYNDTEVSADVTYTYRVCAYNGSGDSAFSDEAIATARHDPYASSDDDNGGGACFIGTARIADGAN